MYHRNILIIHNRIMATVIQKYIMAELPDAVLTVAANVEEGISVTSANRFDAVLCGRELIMDSPDKNRMRLLNNSSADNMVIISSSGDPEKINELGEAGFKHWLVAPFKAEALAATINEVCDPRRNRTNERYHIPQMVATIGVGKIRINAEVINLSEEGILCEFSNSPGLNLFDPAMIELYLDNDQVVKGIRGRLYRSNVLTWDKSNAPERLRAVWQLDQLTREQLDALGSVFTEN